jgi:ParB/RepB/Spo0J family partition protein
MQLEFHQLSLRYEALRIAEPARQARMTASIAELGQQSPVLVVGTEPPWVLIDGYCRVRALTALGRDAVEALVLDLAEPEALLLAHRLDLSRPRSALEQGWFVRELHRTHGISLADLARRSSHSVSWLSRRLALVEALPDPIQARVRAGQLPPHAAMKVLVPLARANAGHAERLASSAAKLPERLSVRQWEALYAAYRSAAPEVRVRIVEHPGLFLRVAEERPRPDDPRTPPEEAFGADLEALCAISRRARRRLRTLPPATLTPELVAALEPTWASARADFSALERLVTERLHDRHRHPDSDPAAAPAGPRHQDHCPNPRHLPQCGQAVAR